MRTLAGHGERARRSENGEVGGKTGRHRQQGRHGLEHALEGPSPETLALGTPRCLSSPLCSRPETACLLRACVALACTAQLLSPRVLLWLSATGPAAIRPATTSAAARAPAAAPPARELGLRDRPRQLRAPLARLLGLKLAAPRASSDAAGATAGFKGRIIGRCVGHRLDRWMSHLRPGWPTQAHDKGNRASQGRLQPGWPCISAQAGRSKRSHWWTGSHVPVQMLFNGRHFPVQTWHVPPACPTITRHNSPTPAWILDPAAKPRTASSCHIRRYTMQTPT